MSNRALGAWLGVIAAVVVTAALTLLTATEPEVVALIGGWKWRTHDPIDPILILVLCGMPLGVLFGSLLGSLPVLARLSPDGRALVVFCGVLAALSIALPYWPSLGLFAIPFTLFHAAYVNREVEPPPPLPVATIKKWSRSAGPSRP